MPEPQKKQAPHRPFIAMCEPCDAWWVVGAIHNHGHALIAMKLGWLCLDCNRPLVVKNLPRQGLPERSRVRAPGLDILAAELRVPTGPGGLRPEEKALFRTFAAMCVDCEVVWVVGRFFDDRYALIAMKLGWLCPECSRPLLMNTRPPGACRRRSHADRRRVPRLAGGDPREPAAQGHRC